MLVVDYGIGNLGSILNMLKKIGVRASLSRASEEVLGANKLILPGVGAFDKAMTNLRERGYIDVLTQRVLVDKIPVLGICLGMQLFSKSSAEGKEEGFGWLDCQTVPFQFNNTSKRLKVPHMGWNRVKICQNSPLFPANDSEHRFYFVHSYYLQCNNPNDILTTTNYGYEFTSSICHENILGVQFHPEKSHRFGMDFLKAFADWKPCVSQMEQG